MDNRIFGSVNKMKLEDSSDEVEEAKNKSKQNSIKKLKIKKEIKKKRKGKKLF